MVTFLVCVCVFLYAGAFVCGGAHIHVYMHPLGFEIWSPGLVRVPTQ